MAAPEGVSVAYGQDALTASPTWTRIDDPALLTVTGWQTHRGRAYVLNQTDTGTANVDYTDLLGTMDPTNSGGPFYPMDPNCPFAIALYNPVTASWHGVYRGLTQNVKNTLDLSEVFLTGNVPASDLFSLLAVAEVPPGLDFDSSDAGTSTANTVGDTTYAQQNVDDRIKAILADFGLPSGLATIFSGNVQVQATVESPGSKILAALRDAADAEFPGIANLFVDKDGLVTFYGRLARFDPTSYSAHTWNVGDWAYVNGGSGRIIIAGLDFDRDVEKVINAARFCPQGIAPGDIPGQLAASTTSIAKYGLRTLSGDDLITAGHVDPGVTTALEETASYGVFYADETTGNYKDVHTRVGQLKLRWLPPEDDNAEDLWNMLCNVEIGDLVNITTTHPGGGGFSAEPCFVEGISYDAKPLGRGDIPDMVDITCMLDLSSREYFNSDPFPTGT